MFRNSAREEIFFKMFQETTESSLHAAKLLEDLLFNYVNVPERVNAIEDMEHKCDNHVHAILEQLNKAFITPIDREDIFLIAKELDNIADSIEACAHRFQMYNIKSIRDEAKTMAKLITHSVQELSELMGEMGNMKNSKLLKQKIIEVNRIEDDGDAIFRQAMTRLFADEKDAVEVIKWKQIYELLEETLDVCEDVANIVEGVVMKHA